MKTTNWPTEPPADAANNGKVNSSIGNRSDTASATGSLHAKVKDCKSSLTTITTSTGTTIPNLHAVPTADVSTNTNMRDVIGNKTDAAVTTVGTTKSIMAYVKGCLNQIAAIASQTVPTADSTDNVYSKDVIGNKTDAAVGSVGTTKSLVGYAKGILEDTGTTIPALHAIIGSADAATNTNMRDVIGRKDDTVAGTSIVALAKQIVEDTGTTLPATLTTIDGLFDVPTADVVTNATVSQVVGNKEDAAVTAVGTTKSLTAYAKGSITNTLNILANQNVPSADAADNVIESDVIGNKTDTTAGNSLVALAKQIVEDTGTTLDTKANTISTAVVTTIPALHTVPTANVATNTNMRDVVGNKTDTAVGTVTTDKSVMGYVKGILNYTEVMADGMVKVTKTATLTAQGGGAGKVVDLFTLTGTVELVQIYGECTEATDATTVNNLLLHLFPAGGAGVDISATGTDYSGIGVGDILVRYNTAATSLLHLDISNANVSDYSRDTCIVTKKTGVVTTIQAEYTSDANTDVDIKWTIVYVPISADGALVAA